MTHNNDDAQEAKISPEFTARLTRLTPQQKVRTIVMLRTDVAGETPARRQTRTERQAMIEAMP